jgi:RNA 2',3'-cyclic 3'-phosphodiesterase
MFIAVPLAADIREAARQARRPLSAYGDRLRWVEPHHLHLTLQFLGDITTAMVTQAVAAAAETAAAETPFTITFAGLGAFPSAAAPRVVWMGVTVGAERLAALAGRLALALRARRFSLEDRPFAPHLTLARVRGTGRPPDLRREAEALGRIVLGEQRVAELIVVKSVLGSSAPTHTIMARAPLGNAVKNAHGGRKNRENVDGTG